MKHILNTYQYIHTHTVKPHHTKEAKHQTKENKTTESFISVRDSANAKKNKHKQKVIQYVYDRSKQTKT